MRKDFVKNKISHHYHKILIAHHLQQLAINITKSQSHQSRMHWEKVRDDEDDAILWLVWGLFLLGILQEKRTRKSSTKHNLHDNGWWWYYKLLHFFFWRAFITCVPKYQQTLTFLSQKWIYPNSPILIALYNCFDFACGEENGLNIQNGKINDAWFLWLHPILIQNQNNIISHIIENNRIKPKSRKIIVLELQLQRLPKKFALFGAVRSVPLVLVNQMEIIQIIIRRQYHNEYFILCTW